MSRKVSWKLLFNFLNGPKIYFYNKSTLCNFTRRHLFGVDATVIERRSILPIEGTMFFSPRNLTQEKTEKMPFLS